MKRKWQKHILLRYAKLLSDIVTIGMELLSVVTTDVSVVDSSQNVHSSAIKSLAELTARSIEQFHKVAEMILLCTSQKVTTLEQAKILSQ